MQRFVDQAGAEGNAPGGVVARQRHAATHQRGGGDRVPGARDVEHGRNVAHAVAGAVDELRRRAVEFEFSGRHFARAEFIFKAIDDDTIGQSLRITGLDIKQRQSFAARRVAHGARQRQRHLRRDGRGEPLAAVQPPGAGFIARHGFTQAHVGAAGGFGHPLAAGPEQTRIAAGEVRHGARDEPVVARCHQRLGGAIGHGERATVDVGRRRKQIGQRKLMHARKFAVPPFVRDGDQTLLCGKAFRRAPQRRHIDAVDAVTPRIPRHMHGFTGAIRQLKSIQFAAREFTHVREGRLNLVQHVWRQRACKIRAQHTIGIILIAKLGRRLHEGHGWVSCCAKTTPP